jgi:hypothetical protein
VITPSLEAVWPDVERRLRALLYKRGLDQPSADDVVQEVALRVIDNDVTYDSPGDLLRWAAPVACRLHVDLLRHRARHVYPEDATEPAAGDDVAGQVADRLELQRALRGIARLRPADRAAIIEAVAGPVPASRQEAVRLAVRRHRARHRLAVVLEHLAAAFGALRLALRNRRTVALATLVPVAAMPFLVAVPHVRPADAAVTPGLTVPAAVSRQEVVHVRDAAPAITRQALTRGGHAAAPAHARGSTEHEAVRVSAPAGLGVRAGTDRRRPGEPILCISDIPLRSQPVCVL